MKSQPFRSAARPFTCLHLSRPFSGHRLSRTPPPRSRTPPPRRTEAGVRSQESEIRRKSVEFILFYVAAPTEEAVGKSGSWQWASMLPPRRRLRTSGCGKWASRPQFEPPTEEAEGTSGSRLTGEPSAPAPSTVRKASALRLIRTLRVQLAGFTRKTPLMPGCQRPPPRSKMSEARLLRRRYCPSPAGAGGWA